ncbi:MAG: Crp/Fnr family transcriptional regulator [Bacteroidetes bacterium]|nr:Crp/Fnr family transcriptional regulator [Bacteroidota bacterium]
MDNLQTTRILRRNFSGLQNQALLDSIAEKSNWLELEEDTILIDVGDQVRVIPLVVEGLVKVVREDEEGRGVLLYYIRPGESCAYSLNSSLQRGKSQIRATAKKGTRLIALPAEVSNELHRNYPLWQAFILNTFAVRFAELLDVIDSVCFEQMDSRLLRYLRNQQQLNDGSSRLEISHQQIANDLHTSREVISRLLKQLEGQGRVQLHRGWLEIQGEL